MIFLGMILAVAGWVATTGLPVFETTVAVLLLTPVLAAPLGKLVGLSWYTYLSVLVGLLWALAALQRRRGVARVGVLAAVRTQRVEFAPVVVWVASAVVAYMLCLLWPDFISMGERLRDYALVSSVLQHPLEAREPWMSGAVLNYYLYWYRFGAMVAQLGFLEVWQTYHLLQSVTVALYLAVFFRFFTRHLSFGGVGALAGAVMITFGSNLAGVVAYAVQDSNWWGPSRVIPGTINEFPAWSFLLGDLHPHFLNLPLLPALLLVAMELPTLLRAQSVWIRWAVGLSCAPLLVAWIFGANAWELPFALITFGVLFVGCGLLIAQESSKSVAAVSAMRWSLGGAAAGIVGLWGITLLLWLQSRNITAPGDPLRVVSLPFASEQISTALVWIAKLVGLRLEPPVAAVTGSPMSPFLMHWGVPLGLICAALIALANDWVERLGKLMALVLGYLSGAAAILLAFIATLQIWRIAEQLWGRERSGRQYGLLVAELLGLAAVLGVLFPELLFVDDPYGGPDERMNTVFKFYSAAWGVMHLAAFALLAAVCKRYPMLRASGRMYWSALVVVLTLSLGFFVTSIKYRAGSQFTVEPYAQGLSGVENQFPGAGVAIQRLEKMPRGVVLEAQGGAYNFSSMVSTLSGNEAFLGWANHVGLLTRNYGEVSRREQLTKEFYTQADCAARKAIMEREGIRYVVLGRFERQSYGAIDRGGMACLQSIIREGEYEIFAAAPVAAQ